jgi:1-aminocyclopropane-1-carboxylate deaminase
MLIPQEISTQELDYPLWKQKGIQVFIRRLDQVHALASGNKFFKLKYNLEQAQKEGKNTLLTFGGAYSNHIYATAAAAKASGFKSIGIIRGEETLPLNPTLNAALEQGMVLHYISREEYRRKKNLDFLDQLKSSFGDFYLVPEGGTNELAVRGTSEILDKTDSGYTHFATSIGTGGTFAGLAKSIGAQQQLLGFSSLKGEFIHGEIANLLDQFNILPKGRIEIFDTYHFGGYGKANDDLIGFIRWFYSEFGIPLDPVYTSKMMYGLIDLINKDYFLEGSKIMALHTGGLQGIAGFNQRFGLSLPL